MKMNIITTLCRLTLSMETVTTQHAYRTLNLSNSEIVIINNSVFEGSIESTSMSIDTTNMTMINDSVMQSVNISSQIINVDRILYLYGAPPLILFCLISIVINIKVLMCVFWIRRPLSPTLYISLSLAGADAFSSSVLGIGLILNSFIPIGLGIKLKGMDCFLLALEVVRLGGVIITVFHLMALAVNHYLGILRPLHYLSILTYRNTTILLVLLWVLPISFFALYFNLIENDGFQSEECKNNVFLFHKQFRMLFSSLFFGPFVLMVCIYVHIFCIVKKHQATRLRFRRAGSSTRARVSEALRSNSRQMARNVKAIHTTLYILGSFVIGWMPGVIMYMLVCNDCVLQLNGVSPRVVFFIYAIINGLIILKTLVNPIIYAARMHEIKLATRRMHDACCGWSKLTHFTTDRGINRIYSSEESRHSQSKTSRLFHNMSVRKARNGSTYTCAGYNIHEYGNTPV
ncbi:trace amine-associated receptor 4 isoform X2 [Solenopsis invicta]|uniref:trace amine-associated receptor 4 isoform X2 n=1 Tax=Solenopsis invicta TaxID=13686 RepID=UPI000E33EC56|nr:trace amine-associated receptor 4 isoform X2 [Solenopsis invicta]